MGHISFFAKVLLLCLFALSVTSCNLMGKSEMVNSGHTHSHHEQNHNSHGQHGPSDNNSHGQHGQSNNQGVMIHTAIPDQARVNKKLHLTAHVEKGGKPLSKVKVQFEFWKGNEKHTYIEAKESKPGEYTAAIAFSSPGEYHIVTHVESENLHEHQESVIRVE